MNEAARGWVDAPGRLIPPLELEDVGLPPVQTSRGLLLPFPITSPGYVYFSTNSVSFELGMVLDFDLTVRLLGPVQLTLPAGSTWQLDAACPTRSDLAPILGMRGHDVTAACVVDPGELQIVFGDGGSLHASSEQGAGWEVEWPNERGPRWRVVGRDGAVEVNGASPPEPPAPIASPPISDSVGPIPPGRLLPIRGPISQCDVSWWTIELEIGHGPENEACIHFAGDLSMTTGGRERTVRGGPEGRQTPDPLLDVVGRTIVRASMDERRLHLDLDDGTTIDTTDDSWEAHWGEYLDEWVPEEGPRFP